MCEKVGQTCLCKLSMQLGRMRHLRHLDLRGNSLERLPEVWSLPRLETLDVRDNLLGAHARVALARPRPLHTCVRDVCVRVFRADAETLPEELASMGALRVVRVANNPLRELPPDLARFIDAS